MTDSLSHQAIQVMFLVLIAKSFFSEIIHKFPVKGHTFLDCDRDFAIIKKAKKCGKSLIPKDLIEHIANARKKKTFLVVNIKTFFNWMNLVKNMIKVKNLQRYCLTSKDFGIILTKKSYDEIVPWISTPVLKPGITKTNFEDLQVDMVETPVHLSAEKKKDIHAMLPYVANCFMKTFQNKDIESVESCVSNVTVATLWLV